jgi:lycopene cyclase domain-containing protein
MPEYTVAAVIGVLAVVAYELLVARTGIFRRPAYWITMAICLFFMVLVNGWLTKLSAPIVRYAPDQKTPWRFPLDIPVEDFLFGFTLLTLVLVLWIRAGAADAAPPPDRSDATEEADHTGRRARG